MPHGHEVEFNIERPWKKVGMAFAILKMSFDSRMQNEGTLRTDNRNLRKKGMRICL
jgi:hypothetical protein